MRQNIFIYIYSYGAYDVLQGFILRCAWLHVFLKGLEVLVSLYTRVLIPLIFCLDVSVCLYFQKVWKVCIRV